MTAEHKVSPPETRTPRSLTRADTLQIVGIAVASATTVAMMDTAGAWVYGIPGPLDTRLLATGIGLVAIGAFLPLLAMGFLTRKFSPGSSASALSLFAKLALGLCLLFFVGRLAWSDYTHGNLGSMNFFDARVSTMLTALGGMIIIWYVLDRLNVTPRDQERALRISALRLVYLVPSLMALLLLAGFHVNNDTWPNAPAWLAITMLSGVAHALIFARRDTAGQSVLSVAVCALVIVGPIATAMLPVDASVPHTRDPGNNPAHVLLLSIDTLRADALTCYNPTSPGASSHATPALDALARDGIRFDEAWSASCWTVPALTSIMTGLSPMVHGTRTSGEVHDNCETLAELFSDAGYRTGAIGKNPHFHPGVRNVEQGFDHYAWFPVLNARRESFGTRIARGVFSHIWPRDADTSGLTEQALQWYRRNAERQSFLWLHYFDPHLPYSPPGEFLPASTGSADKRSSFEPSTYLLTLMRFNDPTPLEEKQRIEELYLSEVRYVDHEIGRLMDALKQAGLYDDTLIVVVSDHGEEFWDHGGFAHGQSLHSELTRVPLIIKPAGRQPGATITEPVSTVDVLPTLIDFCRIPAAAYSLDGRSLAGIDEIPPRAPRPIYMSDTLFSGNQQAIMSEGFLAILKEGEDVPAIYDLAVDPGERHDLAGANPQRAARYAALLAEHARDAGTRRQEIGLEVRNTDLPREILENLETLGYF